jgi:hypothetical protein
VDLSELAVATDNFSGSDIRELVRLAKQHRAKKMVLSVKESQAMVADSAPVAPVAAAVEEGESAVVALPSSGGAGSAGSGAVVRALTKESFEHALHKVKSSGTSRSAPLCLLLHLLRWAQRERGIYLELNAHTPSSFTLLRSRHHEQVRQQAGGQGGHGQVSHLSVLVSCCTLPAFRCFIFSIAGLLVLRYAGLPSIRPKKLCE